MIALVYCSVKYYLDNKVIPLYCSITMYISTVTQKGQVTIPVEIRRKLKLGKDSRVEFVGKNGEIRIEKARDFFSYRGSLRSKRIRGVSLQKVIKMETEAAEKQAVKEYLERMGTTKARK